MEYSKEIQDDLYEALNTLITKNANYQEITYEDIQAGHRALDKADGE